MTTLKFTATENGSHVTKPVNKTLFEEVNKVRALFGEVDFHWGYGRADDWKLDTDNVLTAWVGNEFRSVTIYDNGRPAFVK